MLSRNRTARSEILLVKTSSLGDVVHNFPVVTDILRNVPGACVDWVVEEGLQALPRLHPGVRTVIPAAIRRWRAGFWRADIRGEARTFGRALRERRYAAVIDTQGLIKSALITWRARGRRCGLDWASSREPLGLFYDETFRVPWSLHAVERNRSLVAQVLGYTIDLTPEYGLRCPVAGDAWRPVAPYAVLLHATSDPRKLWDERNWIALAEYLDGVGCDVVLPWGTNDEHARAARLAAEMKRAHVAPRLGLDQAALLLSGARAVVGVDTGLTHLAAAFGVPVVGVYRATDPAATGVYGGSHVVNLGNVGRPPATDAVGQALVRLWRV